MRYVKIFDNIKAKIDGGFLYLIVRNGICDTGYRGEYIGDMSDLITAICRNEITSSNIVPLVLKTGEVVKKSLVETWKIKHY
jgi:hypothetical protein